MPTTTPTGVTEGQSTAANNSAAVWPWLFPFATGHVTQWYGPPVEFGIDIGLPMGTPITSLTDGTVLGVGYPACPGGVVSVESVVNGKLASVYYQHMDRIVVSEGDTVHVGQLLAYSGGQLSGGSHPSQRLCSSGPHIEVGINAPWGGVWHSLGANMDPAPWIRSLIRQGPGVTANATVGALSSFGRKVAINPAPGFLGLEQQLGQAEQFTPPAPFNPSLNPAADAAQIAGIGFTWIMQNALTVAIRSFVVLLGVLLIIGALNAMWEAVINSQAAQQFQAQQQDQRQQLGQAATVAVAAA